MGMMFHGICCRVLQIPNRRSEQALIMLPVTRMLGHPLLQYCGAMLRTSSGRRRMSMIITKLPKIYQIAILPEF
uniref:Uncharacterized protein n=1 Tax=Arundo donax TaxID=35708 RepID=A0A0A9ECG9_ARUDO